MKRFISAFTVLLILLSLSSCRGSADELLPYQRQAAVLNISVTVPDGSIYTAQLTLGEGLYRRDVKMTFTSPPHIAGVQVSCKDTVVTAEVGDLHISGSELEPLLDAASLFSLTGVSVTDTDMSSDSKTVHMTDGVYDYSLTFPRGADRPSSITRTAADGSRLTVMAEVAA